MIEKLPFHITSRLTRVPYTFTAHIVELLGEVMENGSVFMGNENSASFYLLDRNHLGNYPVDDVLGGKFRDQGDIDRKLPPIPGFLIAIAPQVSGRRKFDYMKRDFMSRYSREEIRTALVERGNFSVSNVTHHFPVVYNSLEDQLRSYDLLFKRRVRIIETLNSLREQHERVGVEIPVDAIKGFPSLRKLDDVILKTNLRLNLNPTLQITDSMDLLGSLCTYKINDELVEVVGKYGGVYRAVFDDKLKRRIVAASLNRNGFKKRV